MIIDIERNYHCYPISQMGDTRYQKLLKKPKGRLAENGVHYLWRETYEGGSGEEKETES